MTAAEQAPLWRERLGAHARQLNGSIERLASHFAASPELIDSVAAEIGVLARPGSSKSAKSGAKAAKNPSLDTIAWDAARRFARPRMDDLARRIESDAGWDEIVLPPSQKAMLKAIAAQVRNRATVYENWGFAKRTGGRGLGVSALFAGPSGAGKTLAGEIRLPHRSFGDRFEMDRGNRKEPAPGVRCCRSRIGSSAIRRGRRAVRQTDRGQGQP
jgi:hypothetical protein